MDVSGIESTKSRRRVEKQTQEVGVSFIKKNEGERDISQSGQSDKKSYKKKLQNCSIWPPCEKHAVTF